MCAAYIALFEQCLRSPSANSGCLVLISLREPQLLFAQRNHFHEGFLLGLRVDSDSCATRRAQQQVGLHINKKRPTRPPPERLLKAAGSRLYKSSRVWAATLRIFSLFFSLSFPALHVLADSMAEARIETAI